ncbi:MAG: hypothetical protein LBE27_08545 [Deltaproteobacteria bacterium]|jgi:hypothetical protein|nr:hypothetical protein [Deltaproteobacteria bacterium]
MNKYENKERKDSNPFSMRISIFLGVIFLCVLVITMVTALKELKNIKAVNVLVTEIYDASLPRLIDDQKLLVNIENLRRYAEIAYVSDNAEKRREARINARELISETTAITSDELYADSLLAARAIDGLVRIRNQRDQQEAELMLALSDYLGAMTIFSHYMDTGTFNNTIYNYFLANYMVPSNDLLKKSPEEFQKDLESHVELLRETHIYVRPHLSPPERKTFDDSLAALDLSLTRIDVAVTSIRDLMREMDEQWNEIDLLMKSLRDRVRMGTESSVRNIL